MLWICNRCTAGYSVDAPRCPQCGSTDHRDEGTEPPKAADATASGAENTDEAPKK